MKNTEASIGLEVVRSKGDYVVGRIGIIEFIDTENNRAQIQWKGGNVKTWVSFNSLEPTSIPYAIFPAQYNERGRRISWQKYGRKINQQ